jgi:hypothetical protein
MIDLTLKIEINKPNVKNLINLENENIHINIRLYLICFFHY